MQHQIHVIDFRLFGLDGACQTSTFMLRATLISEFFVQQLILLDSQFQLRFQVRDLMLFLDDNLTFCVF